MRPPEDAAGTRSTERTFKTDAIATLGIWTVGQGLAELLLDKREALKKDYDSN